MNKESKQLLNFLKKQNQMLKDDIKQLNQIIRLNKQALRVSLTFKDKQNYQQSIPQLINLLYEENNKLHVQIRQLKAEIQTGMCQALISQQIAFASTQHEVLLTNELKDKLQKMRKQLQNKQNKIIELSKIVGEDKKDANNYPLMGNNNYEMLKLVQYSDMNKVTKKLKDTIQKQNQQLDQRKEQMQRLNDGKQQLFKLNLILTKQLNQLKLLTSCQTTKSNNQISVQNSTMDLTKYLKYQKKIINEEENIYQNNDDTSNQQDSNECSDSSESQIDEFPSQEEYNQNDKSIIEQKQSKANQSLHSLNLKLKDKVPKQMNMTLNLGNLGFKKGLHDSPPKMEQKPKLNLPNIPKLQLTKAKQIQTLIVKKINNDQKKKKQATNSGMVIKQQKYKKLQQQIQNIRKKMGNQILQKLALQRECNFMKRIISQLEQRNLMLVQKKLKQQEQNSYNKRKQMNQSQNIQTLLDICRDVTLNQRLRKVVLGKEYLQKKQDIQSFQASF